MKVADLVLPLWLLHTPAARLPLSVIEPHGPRERVYHGAAQHSCVPKVALLDARPRGSLRPGHCRLFTCTSRETHRSGLASRQVIAMSSAAQHNKVGGVGLPASGRRMKPQSRQPLCHETSCVDSLLDLPVEGDPPEELVVLAQLQPRGGVLAVLCAAGAIISVRAHGVRHDVLTCAQAARVHQ